MTWLEFMATIKVSIPPGCSPVPRPQESDLTDYKRQTGFSLPVTYKHFLLAFGPGLLSDFQIRSPGYQGLGSTESLQQFNESIRSSLDPDDVKERFTDAERVLRLVYFATNSGGDFVGWDPEDIRDEIGNEYGIYFLLRHVNCATFGTDSFSSFVMDFCFGSSFIKLVGDDSEVLPPRIMVPDCVE